MDASLCPSASPPSQTVLELAAIAEQHPLFFYLLFGLATVVAMAGEIALLFAATIIFFGTLFFILFTGLEILDIITRRLFDYKVLPVKSRFPGEYFLKLCEFYGVDCTIFGYCREVAEEEVADADANA